MTSRNKPKIVKTDAEWRAQLTPMQYEVTRRQATERPGTGPYLHEEKAGLYRCVACGAPLFRSEAKYESGCGWPSFYQPVEADAIAEIDDFSHAMHRIEIRCPQCDSHIGHVFPDGPQPTGLRYCTNGTALKLSPDESNEGSDRDA